MNISIGLSRSAVKRAECADDIADVRIIDVAVNDVCHNFRIIFPLSDFISRRADSRDVITFQKRGAIFGGHPFARQNFI